MVLFMPDGQLIQKCLAYSQSSRNGTFEDTYKRDGLQYREDNIEIILSLPLMLNQSFR